MKKTVALTAGTFDPVTLGHLDLIRRAAAMYDTLVVGIFENPAKTPMFSLEARRAALCEATKDIKNVSVITNSGMLFEYAKSIGADAIVKGIRNETDREYEKIQADFNFNHCGIETILLRSSPEFENVSSSLVRQTILRGGDVRPLLPQGVYEILKADM